MKSIRITCALLAFLLAGTTGQVQAQEAWYRAHTITLEPGRVLLDGREIPASELPEELDVSAINSTMNLSGDSWFEINGHVFKIEDGHLVTADKEDVTGYNVMFYMQDPAKSQYSFRVMQPNTVFGGSRFGKVEDRGPYAVVMEDYVGRLNQKALEMRDLRSVMARRSDQEAVELAERLSVEAENTARIAGAFPRIEFEGYLQNIHQKDENLYHELVREQTLEVRTHELAMQVRNLKDGPERNTRIDELRTELMKIFVLKQQNRENEIRQLEQRLHDLTALMEKRAALKDRIVDSRMKELLGELDW